MLTQGNHCSLNLIEGVFRFRLVKEWGCILFIGLGAELSCVILSFLAFLETLPTLAGVRVV